MKILRLLAVAILTCVLTTGCVDTIVKAFTKSSGTEETTENIEDVEVTDDNSIQAALENSEAATSLNDPEYIEQEEAVEESEEYADDLTPADGKWLKEKEYNFSYPANFKRHEEFIGDIPATLITYKNQDVELCLWPMLGNWATLLDEYPVPGTQLGKKTFIKDITYKAKNSIYSGHTKDGRIFYLHILISSGETDHAHVLTLIYPKEKQESVKQLISVVQNWSLPYAR